MLGRGVGLSDIAAGDSAIQRDGNVVQGKSLAFQLAIANDATVPVEVRFIMVRDMSDGAGTAPVITEVLANASTDVLAYRNVLSADASEYKVLWDRKFVLNPVSQPGGMKIMRHNRKLSNARITYTGTAATNYKKGNYFMFAYCEHPTASDVHFALNSRLYYTDN